MDLGSNGYFWPFKPIGTNGLGTTILNPPGYTGHIIYKHFFDNAEYLIIHFFNNMPSITEVYGMSIQMENKVENWSCNLTDWLLLSLSDVWHLLLLCKDPGKFILVFKVFWIWMNIFGAVWTKTYAEWTSVGAICIVDSQ